MTNIHREINARIRAGKAEFLPIQSYEDERQYRRYAIPRQICSYIIDIRKTLARKVTAQEAKESYDRGEVVIGRMLSSGTVPSGASYANWGYKVFVKDGHSPEREKWYSNATWDRYGPGVASLLFGSSGVSSVEWFTV